MASLERNDAFRQRADRDLLFLYATVVESLGWATAALLDQDVELADRVIADDRHVDERCSELTGLIKDRLAMAPLAAEELEYLIAVLQMVPELERSADLAEHVAQRGRQGLGGSITPRARGIIQSMCDVGIRMWNLASRAYAERSRDLPFEINEADDELDNLSATLVREGAESGVEPGVAAELALLARFYERIGDHAVNLARRSAAMAAPRRLSPLSAMRHRRADASGGGAAAGGSAASSVLGHFRRFRLLPSDDSFFDMFQQTATAVREAAEELHLMVQSAPEDVDEHYQRIRGLERRGDQVTLEVARRLDATYVTPYDREDIHALAEELDDVLDEIHAAAALIHIVRVETYLPEVKQQAEILATMGVELEHLIGCLQSKPGARHRLERIEELEREGDNLHRRSMARLFSGEYEALEVIKWKDIVEAMESSINKVEDVSDVVESILVKET